MDETFVNVTKREFDEALPKWKAAGHEIRSTS